jgi:hypothetical protein
MNIKLQILSTLCIYFLFFNSPLRAHDLHKETPAHKVGDKKEFWSWDLNVMPPGDIKLQTTCRGIGDNVYIFVSDDVWLVDVFQKDIEKIICTFDRMTPETSTDKDRGIYEILTETFGQPPDVDHDHRIYFLISQLGKYHSHNFDGYFRFLDELEGKHSNNVEILFLDCENPSDDYHIGIIAHEFQHLIHWQYDRDEVGWIGESLSEAAMILCGYYTDQNHIIGYLNNTDSPLISKHHMSNYGACLLWGTYIYERLGVKFLGNLVREKKNGIKGFQNVLNEMDIAHEFSMIFGDWLVANYLHQMPVTDERFKYKSISFPTTPTIKHYFSLPIHDTGQVSGYGVDYLKFTIKRVKNKKLRINFKSDHPEDFLIKVIKTYSENLSNPSVADVTLSKPTETFDVSGMGLDCREIVLVVSVLKITKEPVPYSFSVSLVPDDRSSTK